MGKILVIRGGALGDFVLTLPVLAALRRHFPQYRLEILGYPSIAALAVAAGLADAVSAIESPRLTGLFVANGSCPPEVGAWFAGFDWIICYLHDPEGVFRTNIGKFTSGKFVVGPHRPDETRSVHASKALLKPLEALGIRDADSRPQLVLAGDATERPTFAKAHLNTATKRRTPLPNPNSTIRLEAPLNADALPTSWGEGIEEAEVVAVPRRAFIAIHPGSGSERKNWPEAKWAELLKWLTNEYAVDFLLIGGESEGDRCARLASGLPGGRAQIARNLPLVDLARRMKGCAAFIGHDSGITHLAAALDLPGLVLWGETNLAVWKPQSARMRVLRCSEGLAALPVADVGEAFELFGWRFRAGNSKLCR